MRIVVFTSDAPILSLSEHSGGADPLAASVGRFFATLRAAGRSRDHSNLNQESATPTAIYAAYLQFALER